MGADLNVRHVLLQGLVLRRRAAQGFRLLPQGLRRGLGLGQLLPQAGVLLPQTGILLGQAAQRLVLRRRLIPLGTQGVKLRLQCLQLLLVLRGGLFDKLHHVLPVKAAEQASLKAGIHSKYPLSLILAYSIPQMPANDKGVRRKRRIMRQITKLSN